MYTSGVQKALQQYSLQRVPSWLAGRQMLEQFTAGKCDWLANPYPGARCFTVAADASHGTPSVRTEGVEKLDSKWRSRHLGVTPAAPSKQDPKPERRVCIVGECVCKGPLKVMFQRVRAWIGDFDFEDLQSGHLVIVWKQSLPIIPGISVQEDSLEKAVASEMTLGTRYTHLSYHARKPFTCVLWPLLAKGADEQGSPGTCLEVEPEMLDGSPHFQSLQLYLQGLDDQCVWEISAARLLRRQVVVPHVSKIRITVTSEKQRKLWSAFSEQNKTKRGKASRSQQDTGVGQSLPTASTSTPSVSQSEQISASAVWDCPLTAAPDEEESLDTTPKSSSDSDVVVGWGMSDDELPKSQDACSKPSSASSSSSSDDRDVGVGLAENPDQAHDDTLPRAPHARELQAEQQRDARVMAEALAMRRAAAEGGLHGVLKLNQSLNNCYACCFAHKDCIKTKTLNRARNKARGPAYAPFLFPSFGHSKMSVSPQKKCRLCCTKSCSCRLLL